MYTVHHEVGRLVEARLTMLRTVDEVVEFEGALRAAFDRVQGKAIICADWRQANILAPDVADRLVELLARGNPRLERSAVLLSREHAAFNLQVERIVREAKNPDRRTFRDPETMRAWVSERMTADERARLAAFLAVAA
jgi:hypothetical protein